MKKNQSKYGSIATGNIFTFVDYRKYLNALCKRGTEGLALSDLARAINIHLSKLSKVLSGDQNLTPDQAYKISKFLKLDERESEYFITMVHEDRSSDPDFRSHLQRTLKKLKQNRDEPEVMTQPSRPFSQSDEALFYSSTLFAEIWLRSMIEGQNSLKTIAEGVHVNLEVVRQAASFLVQTGLCCIEGDKLVARARDVRLGSEARHITQALTNWRFSGLEKIPRKTPRDLFYSEPMSISDSVYDAIRTILNEAIAQSKRKIATDRSEIVACMNIDFFRLEK